jgi:hypothetical protein
VGNTYQYDAFGAQIANTGTTPNPYLYSGERFDKAGAGHHHIATSDNPQYFTLNVGLSSGLLLRRS